MLPDANQDARGVYVDGIRQPSRGVQMSATLRKAPIIPGAIGGLTFRRWALKSAVHCVARWAHDPGARWPDMGRTRSVSRPMAMTPACEEPRSEGGLRFHGVEHGG